MDAEEKKAERIAQREREAQAGLERAATERNQASALFLVVGVVLMAVGVWFLLVNPGDTTYGGDAIVNIHRLTLGETSSIAGVIMFAAGGLIRYR